MSVRGGLRRIVHIVRELPGVSHWRKLEYARRFATQRNVNLYRGVFDSYEAAAASAPRTKSLGYDNQESAQLYAGDLTPFLKDYPAALWLQRAFQEGMNSVFDLGGHFGVKYYAFSERIDYPPRLKWLVCDVPAVVERGREFAVMHDRAQALSFTSEYQDADGIDVLYASGSLQYLPVTLADILASLLCKPRRLVINTTAIHPSRSFFTLNSIGTAFCPYRVMSDPAFVSGVEAQGYVLRDRWETPKDFVIPFERGYDLDCFKGYCFDLKHS